MTNFIVAFFTLTGPLYKNRIVIYFLNPILFNKNTRIHTHTHTFPSFLRDFPTCGVTIGQSQDLFYFICEVGQKGSLTSVFWTSLTYLVDEVPRIFHLSSVLYPLSLFFVSLVSFCCLLYRLHLCWCSY